jgi:hypothetical protein
MIAFLPLQQVQISSTFGFVGEYQKGATETKILVRVVEIFSPTTLFSNILHSWV